MQLAADPITITIAGEAFELRPTLRAAKRLARRHDTFAALYAQILADHVAAAHALIIEGSDDPRAAAAFLDAIELDGARRTLDRLKLPLLRYVLALAGHDGSSDATAPAGKPVPFAEFHASLFAIGTGWLGWSPAETWNATPAEILAAQRGRVGLIGEVLRAVFGTTDDAQPTHNPNAPFDRSAFNSLKQKIAHAR